MAGGALNVYVRDLRPLSAPGAAGATVVTLTDRRPAQAAPAAAPVADRTGSGDGEPGEGILADFRGVAPAVQSFAAGRRR